MKDLTESVNSFLKLEEFSRSTSLDILYHRVVAEIHIGNWFLIERCEEDFLNICRHIGIAKEAINIKRE